MNPAPLPLQHLCNAAIEAARAAGEFIQSVDRETLWRQHKDAGSSPASRIVTEVDLRSEAIIRKGLGDSCTRWDIAFVGEESSHSTGKTLPDRFSKPHFWCVDPLDGTLPFVEGIPGYAVSIALVEQCGSPVIGVVYDPVSGTVVHAIRGQGACRNGSVLRMADQISGTLRVFADASFKTQPDYARMVRALDACAKQGGLDRIEIIYGGGAVKNALQVLDYSAACYLKLPKSGSGGGSIWDFAATACILPEAGAWAGNVHGQPLDLNRRGSTFMNHQGVLFASSAQWAGTLIEALTGQARPL